MGGGGYDHWDLKDDRAREARDHRCETIEGEIARTTDERRLLEIVDLCDKRLCAVRSAKRAAEDRAKREVAYAKELEVVDAELRKKHGLEAP